MFVLVYRHSTESFDSKKQSLFIEQSIIPALLAEKERFLAVFKSQRPETSGGDKGSLYFVGVDGNSFRIRWDHNREIYQMDKPYEHQAYVDQTSYTELSQRDDSYSGVDSVYASPATAPVPQEGYKFRFVPFALGVSPVEFGIMNSVDQPSDVRIVPQEESGTYRVEADAACFDKIVRRNPGFHLGHQITEVI